MVAREIPNLKVSGSIPLFLRFFAFIFPLKNDAVAISFQCNTADTIIISEDFIVFYCNIIYYTR